MIVTIYLMLFIGANPYPTFTILDEFKSMRGCAEAIKEAKLTKEQENKLVCTPVVTSRYKDPI